MEHLLVECQEDECVWWCSECGRALVFLQEGSEWREPKHTKRSTRREKEEE